MKTVLWISRHAMTDAQKADLVRIYQAPLTVQQYPHTLSSVGQIAPLVASAHIIAAVLSIELLQDLVVLAEGKPVIYSKSKRRATGRTLHLPNGETLPEFAFVHNGWYEIQTLRLQVRPL